MRAIPWATLLSVCALRLIALTASAADDLTRPIRASADGHFLVQPDGEPFFWLGDTAWELLYRLNREETDRYLLDRSRKGFNVIQAVATGKLDFAGLKSPNREGQVPFVDSDPARPSNKYFEHLDWVVDRANHYSIRVALLPAWSAFFVSGGPSQVFNTVNAEEYGRWLGRRYRHRGVIWVLGGDISPLSYKAWQTTKDEHGNTQFLIDKVVVDYRPIYDAMAKGILAGDGGRAFITYHPAASSVSGAAEPRMSLYFGGRGWFGMSMLQSGQSKVGLGDEDGGTYDSSGDFSWNATFNYVPIAHEYKAAPVHPVIDGESRYENHPMYDAHFEAHTSWQARDARNALYHALFAGAAGHTYGHVAVWDFYDPALHHGQTAPGMFDELTAKVSRTSWQEALNAPGAGQMQYAKALMLSRPYFSRVPDQTLIVGDQRRGNEHVGATRDREGAYAMVYLPQGNPLTVDLAKMSGSRVIAWWFNPRTDKATKMPAIYPTGQKTVFYPPTRGEDQDWVLVLDREDRHFAPPGIDP